MMTPRWRDPTMPRWRGEDNPWRGDDPWRRGHDPSPWKPITILAVILIIVFMPYIGARPQPLMVYKRSPAWSLFPLPLLLIPVALFVVAEWLFGTPWYYHPAFHRPSRRVSYPWEYSSRDTRRFFRDPRMMALPPTAWQQHQGSRRGCWPWSRAPGYGDWVDPASAHNGYMGDYHHHHENRSLWSSFMDYGGHWLLILLGIALFATMGGV